MKKIILIISAVLLALGILGCAVTALPTLLEGEKYMNNIIDKNSEKQEFTFTDTFSGLDISVLSANANISYNSGNEVKVSYVTVDKNKKIECNITDGTLNIKEKSGFSFFSLFPFLHDILKSGKRTYLTDVILSDSTSTDRRIK